MFRIADSSSDDDDHRRKHHTSSVPFPSLTIQRTASSPILLSNGKPLKPSLKSSLKSSSSTPALPSHARARSEPSTPIMTPKNVHFPSQEEGGLVSVRLFNRSAKPASLSKPPGCDDTETETETEASRSFIPWPSAGSYFKSIASPPSKKTYELDSSKSSSVPCKVEDPHHLAFANVHLESANVKINSVTGTVLVRNIAYEKQVAVRFTLDDWQTTSEVLAHHMTSLSQLPAEFLRSVSSAWTIGDLAASTSSMAPQWDRFTFTINLEDYALNLDHKTMWLVVRYSVPPDDAGPGEWWDNNSGGNYRIGFRAVVTGSQIPKPASVTPLPPRSSSAFAAGTFSHQKFYSFPHSMHKQPITPSFPFNYQQQQQQQQSRHDDEADHAAHQAAVAQTTLSRLKKLNLRNYAAPTPSPNVSPVSSRRPSVSTSSAPPPPVPSPVSVTPIASTPDSLTSSSSSSADTTPVSSPKPDFLGLGFVPGHDFEFGIEMGGGAMEFQDGAPATHVEDWNFGTSPPFSTLSGVMKHHRPPAHHPTSHPPTIATTQSVPPHPPRRVRRPPSPPPRSSWVRSIGTLSGDKASSSSSSSSSSSEAETVREEVREMEGVQKTRAPSPPRRPPMIKSSEMGSLLDVIKEKSTSGGRHLQSSSSSSSSSSSGSSSDSDEENDDGVIYTRSSPGSPRSRDTATPTPTRSMTPTPLPPAVVATTPQAQTDSVYQAFVRQWCFAHGSPGGSPGVVVR